MSNESALRVGGIASLPHHLERLVAAEHDRVAAIEEGEKITYGQLREWARRTGAAFVALGLDRGDRICIWLPNSVDWMVASLAAHYAGCVVVPLNTRYRLAEAEYILAKSRSRLVITTSRFLGRDYVSEVSSLQPVLTELAHVVDVHGRPGALSFADLADHGGDDSEVARRLAAMNPDDVGDILFTSGTTGRPKGAMITHRAALHAIEVANESLLLRSDDVHLVISPFFHMLGYKYGWAYSVLLGSCVLPDAVFDAERIAKLVESAGVTVLSGPPTLFQSLLTFRNRSAYDLSSLRFSVTGSSRVPPELIRRMKSDLGIKRVATGYGLTESTGAGTFTRPDADIETVAHTAGRVVRDVELRLVRPDGTSCDTDEAGEIEIRGFCVMKGYFEDPLATEKAIDVDGWLHTGDLGAMDADGNLRIVGRIKEVVIVGGMNVYPAEVERVLIEHPAVRDVAILGHPDARMGEVPIAYIESPPGSIIDEAELTAWCRERLANFKVPRRFIQLEALPRNATGKVDRITLLSRGDTTQEDSAEVLPNG